MTNNVLNVFPLIGGGFLGVEFLKFKGYDIENSKIGFSLLGAKANEDILTQNKNIDIKYWDDEFKEVECDCITCSKKTMFDLFEDSEFDKECEKIKACIKKYSQEINDVKIMISIPPCNSLSMLNNQQHSRKGKHNPDSQLMIRCLEFALQINTELFIFENAPRLATNGGIPLLKQIEKRIENYPE